MRIFDYPEQAPVKTDDPERISNLLRKGWTERPEPPAHDPEAQEAVWIAGDWQIVPETFRAARIAEVKEAARAHILAALPEWRQANMTARAVELTRAQIAGGLSAEQEAELVAIESAWAWVKAVRAASRAAEDQVLLAPRSQVAAVPIPAFPAFQV